MTPTFNGRPMQGCILVSWLFQSPRRTLIEGYRILDRQQRKQQVTSWVLERLEARRRLLLRPLSPLAKLKKPLLLGLGWQDGKETHR